MSTIPPVKRKAYTVKEACAVANICRTKLYDAIRRGELKKLKFDTKTLIAVDELDRWFAARTGQTA